MTFLLSHITRKQTSQLENIFGVSARSDSGWNKSLILAPSNSNLYAFASHCFKFLLFFFLFIHEAFSLCACLRAQVYPGQPASASYAMSGTAVQGYTVPMEQLPAGAPLPGQPAPRWDSHRSAARHPGSIKHTTEVWVLGFSCDLACRYVFSHRFRDEADFTSSVAPPHATPV